MSLASAVYRDERGTHNRSTEDLKPSMTVQQFIADLEKLVDAVCTRIGQNKVAIMNKEARLSLHAHNEQPGVAMPPETKRPYKFGGAALVVSGILFVVLAFLDFRTGPPPSNGAEILLWRDSQAPVLDFVSELLFFATVLLVPGTIALYQNLADVDRTKAAAGCGMVRCGGVATGQDARQSRLKPRVAVIGDVRRSSDHELPE
jgi:hypothetical protein